MLDPTSDTHDRIHDRIAKAAPSRVWSRADFLDIGLPTAVFARTTIHAGTFPRTIEIDANAGDPKATKPVYALDFKRISRRVRTVRRSCGICARISKPSRRRCILW